MNKQQWVLLLAALALIAGSAGLLARFHTHQKLGPPGVKTSPLAGSRRLQVVLPEHVLDYDSKSVEPDEQTLTGLPADTSFGQRLYKAPDGFELSLNVVLMGSDRSSLHKPQYCLAGQGWGIDELASAEAKVPVERPYRYDLPVVKLIAAKEATVNGRPIVARGVYVYWYAADGALSASTAGFQRMWWMAKDMLRTGVLQRWAYVACFSVCPPGHEDATFDRMTRFIAASVPEFLLPPPPAPAGGATRP